MKIKKSSYHNSIEFVGGGGLSTVLGLCLMGVGVTLYTLLFTRKEMMESFATFTYTGGTFLFLLGLLIGFCRHGVRVNRRLDELERWWGFLFIPLKTKKIKRSLFSCIKLVKHVHRSKNGTTFTYPVELYSEQTACIVLFCCGDPLKSRQFAETAAKGLELPLREEYDGIKTERNHDELDLSIRQLAEKNQESYTIEDAGTIPEKLAAHCEVRPNFLALEFPEKPNPLLKIFFFLPLLFILPAFPLFFIFFTRLHKQAIPGPFFVFIGIFFLTMPLLAVFTLRNRIKKLTGPEKIAATADQLILFYAGRQQSWAADDIEELILAPKPKRTSNPLAMLANLSTGGGILVRSDTCYATFSQQLSEAEQAWLYKVLYAILTSKKK